MLIREFAPAQPKHLPPPPLARQRYVAPSPVYRTARTKVWPFVIATGATVAIAGASGIANFATQLSSLAEPIGDARATVAIVPEVRVERHATASKASDSGVVSVGPSKAIDAGAPRSARTTRPKTTSLPVAAPSPPPPPKAPAFDTQAAVQGLDAAKAKAEASCTSSSVASLFVQMGFDADGRNRGAALSNSKFAGTPEAKCVLKIFRAVRIPAFDPATRPSGLGRMVKL